MSWGGYYIMNLFADFEKFNSEISDNNFFLNTKIAAKELEAEILPISRNKSIIENTLHSNPLILSRINDYDSNLINDSLAQHLPTESLKLEFLIEKAEKELKEIDIDIQSLKLLNLNTDSNKLKGMENRKNEILIKLELYKKEYRNLDKFNAITDIFTNLYGFAKTNADNAKSLVFDNPLAKNVKNSIPIIKKGEDLKEMNRKFLFLTGSINRMSEKKVSFGSLTSQRNLAQYLNEVNKLNKQYTNLMSLPLNNKEVKQQPKLIIFIKELRDLISKTLNY